MSTIAQRFALGGGSGLQAVADGALRRLRALGRSLARRKAVQDLGRLDDRMLADMGLTRSDLAAAARWSLWADPTDRLAELAEERRAAQR